MKQKRKEHSRGRWTQTEQEIRDLLTEYSRQDQSVKMFCQGKGLPEWRFYSWKKKYGSAQQPEDQPAGFVALQVRKIQDKVARQAGELFAEVQSAQGTCIRIFQPVAASYLIFSRCCRNPNPHVSTQQPVSLLPVLWKSGFS